MNNLAWAKHPGLKKGPLKQFLIKYRFLASQWNAYVSLYCIWIVGGSYSQKPKVTIIQLSILLRNDSSKILSNFKDDSIETEEGV